MIAREHRSVRQYEFSSSLSRHTDAAGVDRHGCEIIAEKVDFLSRPKAGEGEDPELVDREEQFAS